MTLWQAEIMRSSEPKWYNYGLGRAYHLTFLSSSRKFLIFHSRSISSNLMTFPNKIKNESV
jgi:hypothetical protein